MTHANAGTADQSEPAPQAAHAPQALRAPQALGAPHALRAPEALRAQALQAREDENAAAVIMVLTVIADCRTAPVASEAASLWGSPTYQLRAATEPPGPSTWWASGLPR